MDALDREVAKDARLQQPVPRARRGFAAMDPEKQREIARKGGRASGGRPENLRGVDRRAAGRKGGHAVVSKYGPQHMAEIGRKGGKSSGGYGGRGRPIEVEAAQRAGATADAGAAPATATATATAPDATRRHVDEALRPPLGAATAARQAEEEDEGEQAQA